MSLDITSHNQITQGWSDDDPSTVRDSEGRQVLLMSTPPADWMHNPTCGYLMCDGLVMLDQNDRPIKDYPGAPRTMGSKKSQSPAIVLEGLRRLLGMTYSDMRARMPSTTYTLSGKSSVRGTRFLSNRVKRWREDVDKRGIMIHPWFDRTKGKVA